MDTTDRKDPKTAKDPFYAYLDGDQWQLYAEDEETPVEWPDDFPDYMTTADMRERGITVV